MNISKESATRCFSAMLMTVLLVLITGCVSIVRYDGPYKGQIIDADTKRPLEGVVVVGVWNVRHPNIAGANYTFYDAIEVVTGSDGEFYFKGKGLRVFSNLEEMSVQIFKAGYEEVSFAPWASLHNIVMKNVRWQGDKPIIALKKLNFEERKKQGIPSEIILVPDYKQKQLLNEIDKESKEMGHPHGYGY